MGFRGQPFFLSLSLLAVPPIFITYSSSLAYLLAWLLIARFLNSPPTRLCRFPTFVGEAADKKEAKDAEVPGSRRV